MTKIAIRPEIRGFKSYTQAYNVTRNMARGLASNFLLVQDHHGLYCFVKVESAAPYHVVKRSHTDARLVMARMATLATLNYLGAVVVAEFNSKGDEVE